MHRVATALTDGRPGRPASPSRPVANASSGRRRAARACAAATAGCLLALATVTPGAGAQVPVGAPLGFAANDPEGCESTVLPPLRPVIGVPPTCTFWGIDAAGGWTSQTPRGGWTITRARVRTGARVGPMAFTVVRALRSQAGDRPAGIICCTSPAESQAFTPAPNSINEVAVNLPVVNTVEVIDGEPVEVVDYLGITLLSLGSSAPMHVAAPGGPGSSATVSAIAPALRVGGQALMTGALPARVVLVNADYLPTGAGRPQTPIAPVGPPPLPPGPTGPPPPGPAVPVPPPLGGFAVLPGVRSILGGDGARLGVQLPGAGVLRATSPSQARGAAQGASARASRRAGRRSGRGRGTRPLLRRTVLRVRAAGRRSVTLRLTRTGRRVRAGRGRLRIPVRLAFTPVGGRASTVTRTVTFEAPRPRPGRARRGARRSG